MKTSQYSDMRGQRHAVLYTRVSSKDQERGFSISAQTKLLNDYAIEKGINVAKEFTDIETAKESGRAQFNEMVRYVRRHSTVRIILVEKTDRLYRNLKDWVTMDELEVEIHFVKEGEVISKESRSSEKFMHGIRVLVAKNFIDNLSEETKKGMTEKAEQGIWPSFAPFGYRNVSDENGKRVISVDPDTAPSVFKLYDWYATGDYSIRELGKKARASGIVHGKRQTPIPNSTIQVILRNRIYTGDFEWNGRFYDGRHEPIVELGLWERVQGILDGRNASKDKPARRQLTYAGLVRCGHCGCALVGEIKKKKYIYYHCTGNKGKCGEPYTRQEVLAEQFQVHLQRLQFDDDVFTWLRQALIDSFADEKREFNNEMRRLEAENDQLQNRIDNMYIDKLDGKN